MVGQTKQREQLDHIIASAEPVMAPGNSDLPSNSIPINSIISVAMNNPQCEGGPSSSSIQNEVDPKQVGEHDISTPATNGSPGYTGTCTQLDEKNYLSADGSQVGTHSGNGSRFYHSPGYSPYPSGGVDTQCTDQLSYLPSSEYLQYPVSYGSEAAPCYSWNSTYVAGAAHGNTGSGYEKYGAKSTGFAKSNGKRDDIFSKSSYAQHTRCQNKASQLGSDFSAGRLKRDDHVEKVSAFTGPKQGPCLHNRPVNFTQNGRVWTGDYRDKSRDGFKGSSDFDTTVELTCGPRALNKNAASESPAKKEDSALAGRREQYNRPDFEVEHLNAKFYVIKSYSEDDIHKSIKYDVWASTPNGNKKLDAAFHKAQEISTESGSKCPIFLFFSVNGSGQFVGLAEMVGQVDFNKDMDFWQIDKWNGFFPVRWHVVKDIPNYKLRHIVLENNEGKPVTFTRDTQEVGLKQGLEMLTIFKSYSAETSLLDDLAFYENREKSLAKKPNKLATLKMEIPEEDGNGEFFPLSARIPATRMVEGRYEDKSRTRMVEGRYEDKSRTRMVEGRYEDKSSTRMVEGRYEDKSSTRMVEGRYEDKSRTRMVERRYEDRSSTSMVEGRYEDKSRTRMVEGRYEDRSRTRMVEGRYEDKSSTRMVEGRYEDKSRTRMVEGRYEDKSRTRTRMIEGRYEDKSRTRTRMVEGRYEDQSRTRTRNPSAIISQTKNLSLNDCNNNFKQQTSVNKSIRRPIPSLPAP